MDPKNDAATKAADDAATKADDKGKDVAEPNPKIAELMKDPDAIARLVNERSRFLGESQKYLQELNKLEKAKKDAADKALSDQGQFKELAERAKADLETAKTAFSKRLVDVLLRAEAVSLGTVDADAVMALADRTGIKVSGDGFETIEGVKESVEALKKAKAYLFGDVEDKGGDTPPPDGSKPGSEKGKGQAVDFDKASPRDLINKGLAEKKP